MPSLDPVFSVGRGGAGNMMNANTAQKAENEVVLQEEGIRKGKNKSGSFKADKEGNYTVSAGRGGAGNIYKVKEDPLTTRNREDAQNQDHEMEDLRPVYSVGRGGAGNMVWRNKKDKKQQRCDEYNYKRGHRSQHFSSSFGCVWEELCGKLAG
ncbi:hypothetical protein AWRI1499_4709 [Brettanomyces bruxellensis AWRI1499]|nr:hypothetical protein AWRI1499_4709 [Brettanomyces bruxellensis AWRI1499]